jgi:hypothetical protein
MPSEPEPHRGGEPSTAIADVSPARGRCNELLVSFLAFVLIAFGVWVVLGGKRYRAEYAAHTQGWRVGTTRVVELTLVREDKANLSCASKHRVAGLRCAHDEHQKPVESLSADRPEVLQPYATTGGDLLLGAGLWTSPDMKHDLPSKRFSVVCDYDIKGVLKSALIRFDTNAPFKPMGRTVTVGTLTNCLVPR